MLDFQIVQAPMRLGLAEGVEPHQAPFGTLTRAENACWSKTGLLEKRRGTQALGKTVTTGGSIGTAKRLMVRGSELSLTDGEKLYTNSPAGWIDKGIVPNIGLTWSTTHTGLATVKASDVVVVGTTLVEAWIQGRKGTAITADDHIFVQIRDIATGTVLSRVDFFALHSISNVWSHFRLLASGTSWWLVFGDSSGNINVYRGDTSTFAFSLSVVAATSSLRALDAIVVGTDLIIAYSKQAGGIGLLRVNGTTLTASATGAVTGEASQRINSISIAGAAGEPLHITYVLAGDVTDKIRYASANVSTLAQTLAPVDIYAVGAGVINSSVATVACTRYNANSCILAMGYAATEKGQALLDTAILSNTGSLAITSGPQCWNACPLSKPIAIDNRWVIVASNVTGTTAVGITLGTTWPTSDSFVLDITVGPTVDTPKLVGKIASLDGTFWAPGYVSTIPLDTSGLYYVHAPFACEVAQDTNGVINEPLTGVRLITLTPFGGADMWRSLDLNRESYFCAGTLFGFDGIEAVGVGWPWSPGVYVFLQNTVGGNIGAGTYLYTVVAERRSSSGILHRSPVAESATVIMSSSTGVVQLAPMKNNAGHATILQGAWIGYRTVANGLVEQRIGSPPRFMSFLDDGNMAVQLMVDSSADGDVALATRPALYTEGGELEDMQPLAAQTSTYHQNRIWLVDGSGTTVWFSKDRSSNPEVMPGFHPTMTLTFERPILSLTPLDEKLIAFAADTFWAVLGDGPAPNGQNATYQIVPVQTDVGCINPRSVVSTPSGIMFQSTRGIYLLTRALELTWIGRPVHDELEAYPQITSAILVAGANEVRFTVTGSAIVGEEGGLPVFDTRSQVLVFNYVENQWTTAKYTVDGIYGSVIADACMWQGRWTAVTTLGTVFYETATNALDTAADSSSAWVPLVVETSWANSSGPLTFQSVRNFSFEGVARTAHSLTIDVGFDSDESTYPQTATFDVEALGPESYDISIGTRRKCHAIRFRLTDAAPPVIGANTGEGLSLAILGIEVGQKRGLPKKPVAKTG